MTGSTSPEAGKIVQMTDISHSRNLGTLLRAPFRARNCGSVLNAFQICEEPIDVLRRHSRQSGVYPAFIRLRTPDRAYQLKVYSWDDIRTIHGIFLVEDYITDNTQKMVVDFGSNIGVSAAYFLTGSGDSQAYLFEPVPTNVRRLRENLSQFSGIFTLYEVALWAKDQGKGPLWN